MGIGKPARIEEIAPQHHHELEQRYGHSCLRDGSTPEPAMGLLIAEEPEPGLRLFAVDVELRDCSALENHYADAVYCNLCLEGAMQCLRDSHDGPAHLYAAGDLCLIANAADDAWQNRPLQPGRFRSICVELTPEWLHAQAAFDAAGFAPLLSLPRPTWHSGQVPAALMRKAARLFTGRATDPSACARLALRVLALEIVAECLALLHRQTQDDGNDALQNADTVRLAKVRSLLETRWAHPWTLSELAREAGLAEKRLKRGFRQLYGCTIFGHLQAIRLWRARDLLRAGNPVITTALEVGYRHPASFSRAYRNHFGHPPQAEGS